MPVTKFHPPREIGKILHSASRWPQGRVIKEYKKVIQRGVVSGILLYAAAAVISWYYEAVSGAVLLFALPLLPAFLGEYLVYRFNVYINWIMFIGNKGIAFYTFTGREGRVTESNVIIFDDKLRLLSQVVNHYTNFSYQYTACNCRWLDEQGRGADKISFGYDHNNSNGYAECLYHITEIWTRLKEAAVKRDVEQYGSYTFRAEKGAMSVTVTENDIKFDHKWHLRPFAFSDIKSFRVNQGVLEIETPLALESRIKMTKRNMVVEIQYSEIEDADLLIKIMKRAKKGKRLLP